MQKQKLVTDLKFLAALLGALLAVWSQISDHLATVGVPQHATDVAFAVIGLVAILVAATLQVVENVKTS